MKAPDPQSPGPSASLVESAGTPETIDGDIDAPEPAAGGDGDNPNGIPFRLVVQLK
jgi:hypothetical protein